MESKKEGVASAPTSPESRRTRSNGKGKTIAEATPPSVTVVSTKVTPSPRGGWRKGAAILDFILRLGAISSAIGAAAVMGNNEQILPFFTQFFQFHVQWDDFPMFQFFVFANGAAVVFLILSLPFSIVCIVRPFAVGPRLLLVIVDIFAMALVIAAASAAAAVVYLAHNGSQDANWIAICQQYTDFCQVTSQAVVASFVAAVFLICLIVLSSVALKKGLKREFGW
uniref:Casparian strip membrane protein 3 n=1 Tax=Vigna unguiculata TaxID=3917 RepID=CASP3_VIGUN|nr:RecName: Full=Casparian strip membrane protein 3; Short=VuCASP3 [Vigna unguiculata]